MSHKNLENIDFSEPGHKEVYINFRAYLQSINIKAVFVYPTATIPSFFFDQEMKFYHCKMNSPICERLGGGGGPSVDFLGTFMYKTKKDIFIWFAFCWLEFEEEFELNV